MCYLAVGVEGGGVKGGFTSLKIKVILTVNIIGKYSQNPGNDTKPDGCK